MRAQRYKEQPKEWRTKDSALKIGNVCQECNNGWMSRLEDHVKPILSPMILGKSVIVKPSQQERVAAWLTKCAMMFDSMDKGEVFYDVLDRHDFRKRAAPYSETAAWLGHYAGSMGRAFADHRTLHTKFASGGSVKTHVLTMSIGQVVLQIVSIKRLEYLDLAPQTDLLTNGPQLTDALVQIWPSISERSHGLHRLVSMIRNAISGFLRTVSAETRYERCQGQETGSGEAGTLWISQVISPKPFPGAWRFGAFPTLPSSKPQGTLTSFSEVMDRLQSLQ
jgi:hypothetical protein